MQARTRFYRRLFRVWGWGAGAGTGPGPLIVDLIVDLIMDLIMGPWLSVRIAPSGPTFS